MYHHLCQTIESVLVPYIHTNVTSVTQNTSAKMFQCFLSKANINCCRTVNKTM